MHRNISAIPLLSILIFMSSFMSSFMTSLGAQENRDNQTVRVFIFAGQSNMVGSDSNVEAIRQFPPFAGLEEAQPKVKFSYCLGRETKTQSNGWVALEPVNDIVGPELSFARQVTQETGAPIAIIKCAAGGTHLGGDWNPDEPSGFEMYPLALDLVRESLADLDQQGIDYRLEGFMWHQGENDMFNEEYMANYGDNLKNFLARWRQDLKAPDLKFYIGELCTKTIWGMDLRPRMYAISKGQKAVTASDPNAQYIPTSHVGVEIGGGAGLHYHYGTLGQLEHGANYADAYLENQGARSNVERSLKNWPYKEGSKVKLFVLAGHRNVEGERGFIQNVEHASDDAELLNNDLEVAFRYSLGGGVKKSFGWEPMGPAGYYDTFGPELSFTRRLKLAGEENLAVAKFTHSGSQIIDWTPEGSVAKSRNLYPDFISFILDSIQSLEEKGQEVELTGIFYHLGENDMSWGPFREGAPDRLMALIDQSRVDLRVPELNWYVSQQPPPDDESVNQIDVTARLEEVIGSDKHTFHIKAFSLPPQKKKLVLDTAGIIALGDLLAKSYAGQKSP